MSIREQAQRRWSPGIGYARLVTLFAIVAWLLAALVAAAAAATAVVRLRWRGVRIGLAALLGLASALSLLSVAIGVDEGTWGWLSGSLWTCAAMGIGGLGLVGAALHRAITAPRHGPGQCPSCGYELRGLTRCPECGTAAP